PNEYHLGLKIDIQRKSGSASAEKFRYQVTSGHGLQIEGEWFTTTFLNAMIGLEGERGNFWRDLQDSRSVGIKQGGDQVLKGDGRFVRYGGVAVQYFAAMNVVTDKIFLDDPEETASRQDFIAWARPTRASADVPLDPDRPQFDDMT